MDRDQEPEVTTIGCCGNLDKKTQIGIVVIQSMRVRDL